MIVLWVCGPYKVVKYRTIPSFKYIFGRPHFSSSNPLGV